MAQVAELDLMSNGHPAFEACDQLGLSTTIITLKMHTIHSQF